MDRMLLPALSAFAEVAGEGSFRRAAVKLGISPSALSQTIKGLEDKIGARLINRSTRSVSLTESGQRLLAQIDPSLANIANALRELGDSHNRASGLVRLSASRFAARMILEPHLGEFHLRYPDISLELVLDDGFGDIVADGCDAGIRLHESVGGNMIAVAVSPPMRLAVLGAPHYFETHPTPETPSDLERHRCIVFRPGRSAHRWEFTDPHTGRDIDVEPTGPLIVNGDDLALNAALQGVGLVMHMEHAVRRHLESGALIRVLDAWCPPFNGFDLYMPSREQMAPKMRALVDFLVEKRKAWPQADPDDRSDCGC